MAELTPSECHQRDCLARELLSTWSHPQIADWLWHLNNPDYREDMRDRLNRLRLENRKR